MMEHDIRLNSPVLACCVPKCGTHLLDPILRSLVGMDNVIPHPDKITRLLTATDFYSNPQLENKIYVGHINHSDKLQEIIQDIPKIILIRDPRDYVVSHAHFIDNLKATNTMLNRKFRSLDWDSKLSAVILGMRENDELLPSAYETFLNYGIRWLSSNTILVRFEELVQIRTNTDKINILNILKRITTFLGIQSDNDMLLDQTYMGADPSESRTFRSGRTGDWRGEFKPYHVNQMKWAAPRLVSALGYEYDEDWDLTKSLKTYKQIDSELAANLPSISPQFEDAYHKMRLLPKTSPEVLQILDVWYLKNNIDSENFEVSLEILDNLLSKDPLNGELNYLKAFCLQNLHRDLETALHHYEIALSNKFDEFWTRFNRGSILIDMGKLSLGLEDLEKAAQINPSHEWTRIKIAHIRNILENKEK